MGSQAGLDMSDRDAERFCCKRTPASARSVALHDKHIGRAEELVGEAICDQPGVCVRIILTSASQVDGRELVQTVGREVKTRMLASNDQAGAYLPGLQRVRHRGEFDGFGAGADDQPYVGKTQSSP